MDDRKHHIINGDRTAYVDWLDSRGEIINASDGGILFVDGIYHWYGMALRPLPFRGHGEGGQTTTTGVVMYASEDLLHWDYEGVILPCSDVKGHPLQGPLRFERPKIWFHRQSSSFILMCHYVQAPGDHGFIPGTGETGIAVCDRVNGVYEWMGTTRPVDDTGFVRDNGFYADADGTGWYIFDRQVSDHFSTADPADRATDDRCLYILQMAENGRDFSSRFRRMEEASWREAPVIVRQGDWYYLITSGLTSWDCNQALYYRTRDLLTPWTLMGDPCIDDTDHTTFHAQGSNTFRIMHGPNAGRAVFMAERHQTSNFLHSSYVWLPIDFHEDGTLSITYRESWDPAGMEEAS